ncbi:MAG: PEP-CTERM sorting domain-containing protein, partial [Planctomycetota bacterium]
KSEYQGSDIITINTKADFGVSYFYLDLWATDGTLEEWWLNPVLKYSSNGVIINSGGWLLDNCRGETFDVPTSPPLPAGQVIFSFEFNVPEVTIPTDITIYDSGDRYFQNNDNSIVVQDLTDLTLNVVPEPATILLFGLGGFILRRRKFIS